MSLDFLPQLTSISGNDLLGWDRLWCPLGSQLELDGWHSVGFLRDPSSGLNINCKSLNDWSQFSAGVCVLCGSPGAGKSGAIKLWLDHLKCEEPETFIIAITPADLGGHERFDQIISHREFQQASMNGRFCVYSFR